MMISLFVGFRGAASIVFRDCDVWFMMASAVGLTRYFHCRKVDTVSCAEGWELGKGGEGGALHFKGGK